MHKPPRLTAEAFIEKIEHAQSYAIVMNAVYEEMELIVRERATAPMPAENEVRGYLGPDPETTEQDDLIAFLEKLEAVVKKDAASGKGL